MKKCPYCAEEIQDEAIKCKHCGVMLNKREVSKEGRSTGLKYLGMTILVIGGLWALLGVVNIFDYFARAKSFSNVSFVVLWNIIVHLLFGGLVAGIGGLLVKK